MPARARTGEVEGVPHAPLHPHPRVHRSLGRHLEWRALAEEAALARVHPFGVLTHDDQVDVGMARVGGGDERPVVHEQVELESQAQQDAALDDAGADTGSGADRAEQDGVELADRLEILVGEHHAVTLVALPAEIERDRFVGHRGRVEDA